MGADISVMREGELERDFEREFGSPNQSLLTCMKRAYKGFVKNIKKVERMEYTEENLYKGILYQGEDVHFESLKISHNGTNLAAGVWSESPTLLEQCHKHKPCVIYVHTNTRSLADAVEVLPVCEGLDACLLAFDLPGAGKSPGELAFPDSHALQSVITWAIEHIQPSCFVIWSRGTACGSVFEYIAKYSDHMTLLSMPLACAVFDSPFTSIVELIRSIVDKVHKFGGTIIPKFLYSEYAQFVRKQLYKIYRIDPKKMDNRK